MWAVRGLGAAPVQTQGRAGEPPPPPVPVDPPGLDRAKLAAVLRAKTKDPDRRVRTEAFRTLASHLDDESFAIVLAGLESPDTWISVMAAESFGPAQANRYRSRSAELVPKLVAATALAIAALVAIPIAEAGAGIPQRHPGAEKRPHIIGVLKRPHIIAVLKHPDVLGVRKSGGT